MDEIPDFEAKSKSYQKLLTNYSKEIYRLKEKISCSGLLIKKYNYFLNLVLQIIAYGDDISKKN